MLCTKEQVKQAIKKCSAKNNPVILKHIQFVKEGWKKEKSDNQLNFNYEVICDNS